MPQTVKILLIEGDPILRDLITLALERFEYEVIATTDSLEALKITRKDAPRLMLLDLLSPQTSIAFPLNGIDIVRQMKKEGLLAKTSVIVISALGYREVVQQAAEAGASDFLVKPIQVDLLVQRVQQVLKRTQGLSDRSPKP